MPFRTLPILSAVFVDAARLCRGRFWTLLALALYPIVPVLLTLPFLAATLELLAQGYATAEALAPVIPPWTAVVAALGILFGLLAGLTALGGMIIVLTSPVNPGARQAFRLGIERWVALFWTQLLTLLAAVVALLPSIVFSWFAAWQFAEALTVNRALNTFVQIVAILLALPSLVVVSWYVFAVIPAARGEARGMTALSVSRRLVQGATGQVFGFLLAWVLFEVILWLLLSLFFPGLTLFTTFLYYLLVTIFGAAYLVAIYQALRKA